MITVRSPVPSKGKSFILVVETTSFPFHDTMSLFVSKQGFSMKSLFLIWSLKPSPSFGLPIRFMSVILVLTLYDLGDLNVRYFMPGSFPQFKGVSYFITDGVKQFDIHEIEKTFTCSYFLKLLLYFTMKGNLCKDGR